MLVNVGLTRGAPQDTSIVSGGALSPVMSFSRTQDGQSSSVSADDTTLEFWAANVPRRTGAARRFLTEGLRTNLLLNSAVLASQDVTVAALVSVLSFYGTGSITLSGASTAGPLVGTGTNNRVVLSFTPTVGTLTLTVAGDVRMAQLEAATTFASSYIPTLGSQQQRGTDLVSAPLAAFGVTGAYSAMLRMRFTGGVSINVLCVDDNIGLNNRFFIDYVTGGGGSVRLNSVAGGVLTGPVVVSGGIAVNTDFNLAVTADPATGRIAASLDGGAVVEAVGTPIAGLTTFRPFSRFGAGLPAFAETTTLRVLPYGLSDPDLIAASAALT